MKGFVLTKFLILIFIVAAHAQTAIENKIVKDKYGNFVEYSFYRNSDGSEVRHGKYTQFLANGKKSFEIIYQNGKCDGLQTWYWAENGQKQAEGYCRNDMLTGVWTRWYLNGKKSEECHYENDSLNGVCKFWSENGEFVEEIKYIDNKPTAFIEWEKRNPKKTFLSAHIIVRLGKLEFVSEYANIRKEFKLNELESVIELLPKSVWEGGKIVWIQGTGQRTQDDHKRMFEIMSEIEKHLRQKGFRVRYLPV